ncbi:hypothetical protein NRIC_14690 [Enterococcus florum]|uniref:Uncharacterized protein n=1 Tax=Enterococcus florum TaxID=2480627 RepID=A0A4P5PC93_9ENTE|nr:daptomycin-sensing surface protein LiaX [Enterococcus florum]GCF93578.1 hypothetical protein NRIC_14690 [Enterococcus florum]
MAIRKEILEAIKDGTITPEEGLELLEQIEQSDEIDLEMDHKEEVKPESKESETELKTQEDQVPDEPQDQVANLIDEWLTSDHEKRVDHSEDNKESSSSSGKATSKENDTLKKIHAIDQQIQPINELLKEKQEIHRNLKLEAELEIISEENAALYEQTKEEIAELEAKIDQLKKDKEVVERDFYSIPVWHTEPTDYEELYEDDEEEEQPREPVNDLSTRINQLVNRTLKTVTDTVDGKFTEFGMPSVGRTSFEHQFTFRESSVTDLDIKLANGMVVLKTWPRSDINVEAEIEFHGDVYGTDPLEAFLERSQIEVEEDQLLFHVHNKRIHAELTFYLPEKIYDHLVIRLLNSELVVEEIAAKDMYIKAVNGDLQLDTVNAALLEIQGTDNEIELHNGSINDSIIETVNGSITSKADVVNLDASIVNGEIRITAGNPDLKRIRANSLNGNVKVSLPTMIGLEGVAKTDLGEINYRLSDFQTVRERRDARQRLFHFRREAGSTAQIDVSSKTGSIFLKDFDR